MKDMPNMVDPGTGILLTPSFHGEHCLGNGEYPGLECCCDECDNYLYCFPDWEKLDFSYFYRDKGQELD